MELIFYMFCKFISWTYMNFTILILRLTHTSKLFTYILTSQSVLFKTQFLVWIPILKTRSHLEVIYLYTDLSICTFQDSIFSFSSKFKTRSHLEVIYLYPDLSICTLQDSIFSLSSNIQDSLTPRSDLSVYHGLSVITLQDSIFSLISNIQDSLTPRSDLLINWSVNLIFRC